MKKLSISILVAVLAATSAFAWSKKSQNTGNLGRMYVSLEGGVSSAKVKEQASDATNSPTGGEASVVINAPIFKPGVNTFRDIKWAGVDGSIFFNYSNSGSAKFASTDLSTTSYSVGACLTPYLNLELDLPFLQAIKPFGIAYAGYEWADSSLGDVDSSSSFLIYGVGGGVELVVLDQLSFSPFWVWRGNDKENRPCDQIVGADLSYWFSDNFCFSLYWKHSFNTQVASDYEVQHGDVFGAKIKIGFIR